MRCPHCQKESKAKVLESRKVEGEVWRLRVCALCIKQFVSQETTSKEMKFPWSAVAVKRKLAEVEEAPVQKQNKWVFPDRLW